MKNVLVVLPLEDRHKSKLEAAGEGCTFQYVPQSQASPQQVSQADIIIGNVPPSYIKESQRLEFLQLDSAGADMYVKPGVLAKHTKLSNSTGAYGRAVSEHAFAMSLMLQKKLHLYRDYQNKAQWADAGAVSALCDSTVVVVGLGDIGLRYARMVKAMGAYVIGVKRRGGACPEGVDELCTTDRLDEALVRADVVASFLPGTPDTYHMYTLQRFKAMKPSAIFINCGRGTAVDMQTLNQALETGQIAAAGVDVTEIEPLPADSPLWHQPKLMLTPHISGSYHLPEILETVVDISCYNLKAVLSGGELKNTVDFETGYKK